MYTACTATPFRSEYKALSLQIALTFAYSRLGSKTCFQMESATCRLCLAVLLSRCLDRPPPEGVNDWALLSESTLEESSSSTLESWLGEKSGMDALAADAAPAAGDLSALSWRNRVTLTLLEVMG